MPCVLSRTLVGLDRRGFAPAALQVYDGAQISQKRIDLSMIGR